MSEEIKQAAVPVADKPYPTPKFPEFGRDVEIAAGYCKKSMPNLAERLQSLAKILSQGADYPQAAFARGVRLGLSTGAQTTEYGVLQVIREGWKRDCEIRGAAVPVDPAPQDLEKQCQGLAEAAIANGQGLLLMESENGDLRSALQGCIGVIERNGWNFAAMPADDSAYKVAKKMVKGNSVATQGPSPQAASDPHVQRAHDILDAWFARQRPIDQVAGTGTMIKVVIDELTKALAAPSPVSAGLTLKPGPFLDAARDLAAQVTHMSLESQAVEVTAQGSGFREAPVSAPAAEAEKWPPADIWNYNVRQTRDPESPEPVQEWVPHSWYMRLFGKADAEIRRLQDSESYWRKKASAAAPIPGGSDIREGAVRHCAMCGWLMVHGPGIGDYCPNPDCDNLDGPAKEDQDGSASLAEASPQIREEGE